MDLADIAIELDDLSETLDLPRLAELAEALAEHIEIEMGLGEANISAYIDPNTIQGGTITLSASGINISGNQYNNGVALNSALSSSKVI